MAVRAYPSLVIPEFLYVVLCANSLYLSKIATGATVPGLSITDLATLSLEVPDLPTQRRIAARLKEQMAGVEAARKALDEQSDALSLLPGAYLREAFGEGDGEDPGFTKI